MRYYDEQYDDRPDTIFAHSKTVTTRKPHKCDGCAYVLPTSSRAVKFWVLTSEDDKPRGGYECVALHLHATCLADAIKAKEQYDASRQQPTTL